jgi:hypothetical protein
VAASGNQEQMGLVVVEEVPLVVVGQQLHLQVEMVRLALYF